MDDNAHVPRVEDGDGDDGEEEEEEKVEENVDGLNGLMFWYVLPSSLLPSRLFPTDNSEGEEEGEEERGCISPQANMP